MRPDRPPGESRGESALVLTGWKRNGLRPRIPLLPTRTVTPFLRDPSLGPKLRLQQ